MSKLHFTIRKGLDLPITGAPEQRIDGASRPCTTVAVLGADSIGLKPTMLVEPGTRVRLGQAVFEDKRNPGVVRTAPAAGEVTAVWRGAKRTFQSLVIRLDGDDAEHFEIDGATAESASRAQIKEILRRSGTWNVLRARPYGKVPPLDAVPAAILVNAMDSNPLAAEPQVVLAERATDFQLGLSALARLTDGKLFVCTAPGADIPGLDASHVTHATFEGPHPAGLAGTHIHFLQPVSATRSVWHTDYQACAAIGHLMRTGRIDPTRVVAIGGPAAKQPRLVRTRIGANLTELLDGEIADPSREVRIVSGSVLSGTAVTDAERLGFLGARDRQVSLLYEGRERVFLGWQRPGFDEFSVKNVFMSAFRRAAKQFAFTTSTHGSPRAMVPIGCFEKVMPLDILPTFLLRALLCGDSDQAQRLGALELTEEDLGLCTFVCPGKTEYGPILRQSLERIERDG